MHFAPIQLLTNSTSLPTGGAVSNTSPRNKRSNQIDDITHVIVDEDGQTWTHSTRPGPYFLCRGGRGLEQSQVRPS